MFQVFLLPFPFIFNGGKIPLFFPTGNLQGFTRLKQRAEQGKDSNFRSSDISKSPGSQEGNSLEPVGQTNSSLQPAPWEAEGLCSPGGAAGKQEPTWPSWRARRRRGAGRTAHAFRRYLKEEENSPNRAEIKMRRGPFVYLRVAHYCSCTLIEEHFLPVPNEPRTADAQ